MRHKRIAILFGLALCCLFPGTAYSGGASFLIDLARRNNLVAPGQCPSQPIIASGLRAPSKLIFTHLGNLLVAESGSGPNTGRISLVDPATGHQRTLVDGLPSGFTYPSNISSGPSGLVMRGRTLYVTIGEGDSTVYGTVPGTHLPNPSLSSPLFSSVLAIDFSARVERETAGFIMTYADHLALRDGGELKLDNGSGDQIKVSLVADFPDYLPEPRKDEPNNVRPSDPFGLVMVSNHLYVADAGSNSIRVVDLQTGDTNTLITFAPLPNPQFPIGPSKIRAVPVNIRLLDDQLLVTLLTAPPFPTDAAQVRIVDPATGVDAPFITGLTLATDVLPIKGPGRTNEFLALELGGSLRRFAMREGVPVLVADCMTTPTSFARDERTGELFVTEIFTGQVVKVAASLIPSAGNNVFGFEPQPILAGAQK